MFRSERSKSESVASPLDIQVIKPMMNRSSLACQVEEGRKKVVHPKSDQTVPHSLEKEPVNCTDVNERQTELIP